MSWLDGAALSGFLPPLYSSPMMDAHNPTPFQTLSDGLLCAIRAQDDHSRDRPFHVLLCLDGAGATLRQGPAQPDHARGRQLSLRGLRLVLERVESLALPPANNPAVW